MAKIVIWSKEQAKVELAKRLMFAKEARRRMENEWESNERTLFDTRGRGYNGRFGTTFEALAEITTEDVDQSNTDYGINYAFKNYRFIHSQLSANPPTVITRPTSSDPSDRRKADAADRLVRYALRKYSLMELFDQASGSALRSGTGWLKTVWNPDAGEILDMDEETEELVMEGDIEITSPSYWDVFPDPDATIWPEVKWVFERMFIPYEEALYLFPDKEDILKQHRTQQDAPRQENQDRTPMTTKKYDVVEIYQYWEKGLPYNGFQGRFCHVTKDGEVLDKEGVQVSPHRFAPPRDKGVDAPEKISPSEPKMFARAELPYHIFTDIDMQETVLGRSFVAYETPLQELHNKLINVTVDALQAHGVPRLILPGDTNIADDSITNSPWDVIKTTGNRDPKFMEPMPLPPALGQMLQLAKTGIDDLAGVNESMFGQQSREQSGFSMQYATNQGNMIRRRVFNKYTLFVESVYRAYLNIIKKHWVESRLISVLGKEKAFESLDIKGADIDGGYDLVVEYGASLSLDPTMRRQEMLSLMPLFEKAGIDTRKILELMKLNELEGAYDLPGLARDRQREIFDQMIATKQYVAPRELQDHKNMLSYAYEFVMTAEYKYLAEESKQLIDQHIKEREALAAQGAQPPVAPGPGGAPGPMGGVLPGGQAPLGAQEQVNPLING